MNADPSNRKLKPIGVIYSSEPELSGAARWSGKKNPWNNLTNHVGRRGTLSSLILVRKFYMRQNLTQSTNTKEWQIPSCDVSLQRGPC